MENDPLVSIIVNCYNSEQYLYDTILSVLGQTYARWEMIFWDNCSTDNTPQIIKQIRDARIKYYYAESKTSLGAARNLAMEKVSGDYVCFLDSDDMFESEFLQRCVDVLKRNTDIGLVYTRYIHFTQRESWLSKGFSKDGVVKTGKLVSGYNIGMSAAMFRRSIIKEKNIIFDTRFSLIEDFDFFLKISSRSGAYYISEPLMRYRHHDNNASKSDRWAEELEQMIDSIKNDNNYEALRPICSKVRNLRCYYSIMTALDKKERMKALQLILRHCFVDIGVLRYLFSVFFGKKAYLIIRKRIDNLSHG